jgi:septal ring factor EnvC (AmiA/AmiB activator)
MTIDLHDAFFSNSPFSSFFAPTEIYVVAREDIEKAKLEQTKKQLEAINNRIAYYEEQKAEVQKELDKLTPKKETETNA